MTRQVVWVLPSNPWDSKEVDEGFADQAKALQEAGFEVLLFDLEGMKWTSASKNKLQKWKDEGVPLNLQYRGWMMDAKGWDQWRACCEPWDDSVLSVKEYQRAHEFSGWYEQLKSWTMESVWIKNPSWQETVETWRRLGWEDAFVKDFVKSLKTNPGPRVKNETDLKNAWEASLHYRGKIEGGWVFRRWTEIDPSSEVRWFVWNGQCHAPGPCEMQLKEKVESMMKVWDHPFYAMDWVKTKEGQWMLVEVGAGGVSDLVGDWTPQSWSQAMKKSVAPPRKDEEK